METAVGGDFWGVPVRGGLPVIEERMGREEGIFGSELEEVLVGLSWRVGSGICCGMGGTGVKLAVLGSRDFEELLGGGGRWRD